MEDEDIESMIDDCFRRETRMNEWERNFLHNICEQIDRGLSPAQADKLEAIWDRVTSQ